MPPPRPGLARYLIDQVRDGVNGGELSYAEEMLTFAEGQIPDDETAVVKELRLTVLLARGTIAQHRNQLEDAQHLGDLAVETAEEAFGFGVQLGRARLRQYYVWEAKREYLRAQRANFALADQLKNHDGSAAVRLNCLTRALACAVKNADRRAQQDAMKLGNALVEGLDEREGREVLSFYLLWCCLARLRQNDRAEALRLLTAADEVAFPIGVPRWRWEVLRDFALANLLYITPGREDEGRAFFQDAREDAQRRGFIYLVESNKELFKHLE